ncbi:MAG TPA: DUF5990 family protein [Vicinamibacterales bacterium]|nr:DUF5990 family protein [Vicinamibacterales bacterium]
MERQLTFRAVLQEPPAGVDFALQIGRGADYKTVQTQRSMGRDLSFEFSVVVKVPNERAAPDFRGPVVQGPTGQRFVYIDIGTYARQTETPWSRRLKIPLTGITRDMFDRASADSSMVLETRVPGTWKDGGPSCGTVKPFGGWKLAR